MSELTRCNYCSLQDMKRRAAKRGATLIMGRDAQGWTTVRYSDEDFVAAYFMQLTRSCVC